MKTYFIDIVPEEQFAIDHFGQAIQKNYGEREPSNKDLWHLANLGLVYRLVEDDGLHQTVIANNLDYFI